MRFIKVMALLALVAVLCRTMLILFLGRPPGIPSGRGISEIAGGGLLIFALSVVAAGIAAYIARDREDDLPGFKAGVIAALAAGVLIYFYEV